MMDRNTLTALLLITLVLILTPYYMEMVSPPSPILEEFASEEPKQNSLPVEYREYENLSNKESEPITQPKIKEETTIKVENDLYIATISSMCGGSIKSFEIKKHLKHDSNFVNLVTPDNIKNLLVSFKDFNGNQIRIDEGWVLQSNADNYYIDAAKSITYTNTINTVSYTHLTLPTILLV